MKWKTAISKKKDGELFIRGHALVELMAGRTFTEVAFLLLGARLPNAKERMMFDMMLVSCIEHGIEVPSAFVPRASVSVGNPMNAAMAAGLLAIGDHHGGATEEAARLLASDLSAQDIVTEILASGKHLPGFGHKIYKDKDPRAEALLARAHELGLAGIHIKKLRALGEELKKRTGKHLSLNIDGALAAVLLELKFDWRLGKAIFGFARMPGMIAHALEEIQNEKPYRRLDEEDVVIDV